MKWSEYELFIATVGYNIYSHASLFTHSICEEYHLYAKNEVEHIYEYGVKNVFHAVILVFFGYGTIQNNKSNWWWKL